MTFASFISAVEARRKTLEVYAGSDGADVAAQFATRNATVESRSLPVGQEAGFVVLRDDGEFVGTVPTRQLRTLLDPPIRRPWDRDPDEPYRSVYELLENTVFASLDRSQLLGAAREIEDRAYRVGSGRLRAGFQRLSAVQVQAPLYRRLASETALEVHVYGRPDWDLQDLGGVSVHGVEGEEVERYWFMSFDGGPDSRNACGLVAEERGDGEFYGFWTYDPDTVADIDEYVGEALD